MNHAVTALALLAPLLQDGGGQEGAARIGPPADDGWKMLDAVIYQAGDEVITFLGLMQYYKYRLDAMNLPVSTQEEQNRLLDQALESLIVLKLESQAGEDQDLLTPVEVERTIDRFLENRRRAHDEGLATYATELESIGLTAIREKEQTKEQFYTQSFRDAGLTGPRPTRDRYVRPGELRRLYHERRAALSEPDQVKFQEIVIVAEAVGGVEIAKSLAEEVLQRLEAGEDFGLLNEEFSVTYRDTLGETEFFEMTKLPPAIEEFAATAKEGDLSAPLPITAPSTGEVRAYRVLKFLERRAGKPAPAFFDPETQDELRQDVLDLRDQLYLRRARLQLRGRAYLWNQTQTEATPALPGP